MNWVTTIYAAVLFFMLTPGVLVSLPPKKGKFIVAAFHALIFALIWHFTHKLVWRMSVRHEGFHEGAATNKKHTTDKEDNDKAAQQYNSIQHKKPKDSSGNRVH